MSSGICGAPARTQRINAEEQQRPDSSGLIQELRDMVQSAENICERVTHLNYIVAGSSEDASASPVNALVKPIPATIPQILADLRRELCATQHRLACIEKALG